MTVEVNIIVIRQPRQKLISNQRPCGSNLDSKSKILKKIRSWLSITRHDPRM